MMKTLGQIGYEAYAVATGGKTWDGRDMPTWAQVQASGTKVEAAWEAAAKAIRAECAARVAAFVAASSDAEEDSAQQVLPLNTTEGPAK